MQLRQSLILTQFKGKHRPHQQVQQLSFQRVFSPSACGRRVHSSLSCRLEQISFSFGVGLMLSCSAYSSWPVLSRFPGCASWHRHMQHLFVLSRISLVWHLVVVVSVIQDVLSREVAVRTLLSSQGCGSSRIFSMHTPCISPSPCLFFSHFLHLSHFPTFPPRDTLHGARSQTLHLSIDPKSGTLGGPSPGYPSVLSISFALNSLLSRRGFIRLSEP